MIPVLGIWKVMLRRSAASAAAWFALGSFPLLLGIHHLKIGGFPAGFIGAFPASIAAFSCLGWRNSTTRNDLRRILDPTRFGEGGLSIAEAAFGTLSGSVAGLVFLLLAHCTGLLPVPWQGWPMPLLTSFQVSCICIGLGRRSTLLPVSVLVLSGALSLLPAPGVFVAMLAFPGHLCRVLESGSPAAMAHPDTYLAVSVLLAAAASALLGRFGLPGGRRS